MTICKFYVKGNCKDINCKFEHINNICKHYFFGNCKFNKDTCKFSHDYKLENNKKKIKKNTETFEPSHEIPDINIKLGDSKIINYNNDILSNDVIIIPNLFCDINSLDLYNDILNEISDLKNDNIFKLWHGDTHFIADDKVDWKKSNKSFNKIIKKIEEYFKMDIQATRLNYYKNTNEWKPYHHDAAAIDPKKAKKQNLTVGVSFGFTRDIAFQHATSKNVISIPLLNGYLYAFANKVNQDFRHGIPQLPPDKQEDKGRISIIAWGKSDYIQ